MTFSAEYARGQNPFFQLGFYRQEPNKPKKMSMNMNRNRKYLGNLSLAYVMIAHIF